MAVASKTVQPPSTPEDPNTGPIGPGGKGQAGTGGYPQTSGSIDQADRGVPGASGAENRGPGTAAGDEVTEETGLTQREAPIHGPSDRT